MMVHGKDKADAFLRDWLADKANVVLVTGRRSFSVCGAEAFFAPHLGGKGVTHLTTSGENPQKADIEALLLRIPEEVDAFIAVGGGTVIDTTKILRAGFPGNPGSSPLPPFLAVPTTAGTGAEATRFAVYYEAGVKRSADDLRYLPTDQLLVREFCGSASPHQRASCAFDAYAQAIESLWAKRATEESKTYARKALELMRGGEQLLGSYWAGRAIDISRTTAAHAFSYYLTATYGVPHGEAVYMTFPYVCRANGHPELVREVPELRTLDSFVAGCGLNRAALIDRLFENVNPARLENNPAEIRKEHFNV